MKTIILSINSRFIHTLLAPRYLKANAKNHNVEIIETNINVNLQELFEELYEKQPNVVAISCYIFNIEYVRKILDEIKLILPNVIVILGGYEAAFDTERYENAVDYIIKGEGDFIFGELLSDIENKTGIYSKIVEAGTVKNLDDIISPYTDEYLKLGNQRILYFETTRGCPYSCSYCMSANTKGVRSFSMQKIKDNLNFIMQYEPKQLKFVDRTFNYDMKRASIIFSYIIDNFSNLKTNFHFEMAPELFNEEMINILKLAKKGLFQFEIGVQSYNAKTLKSVGRNANIDRIENNLKDLQTLKNINIHVDLIAGLPLEGLNSFIDGFDRLIRLKPDCLQLGFLKVLKGSHIHKNEKDIVTFKAPPYEIINTPHIDYADILKLKGVEEMLELFYNSRRFNQSINFIIPNIISPYLFFYEISLYFKERKLNKRNTQATNQCDLLLSFMLKQNQEKRLNIDIDYLKDLISQDYKNSGNLRDWRFRQID